MTSPSKNKGNNFEREIVNLAKSIGLDAKRAYASDGRSLGESEKVDLIIGKTRVQAKRRAKLAAYMLIPEGADIVVMRQDRGDLLAVVPFEKILELMRSGLW